MQKLPFVYTNYQSQKVIRQTKTFLETENNIQESLTNIAWAYHSIWKIIPQTYENLFSGHSFPYQDSWDEIQVSYLLAEQGLYKQAFVSLRLALELGLLSVYFNINDDGHLVVQDWLRSKDSWEANTPRTDKIWEILKSNANIAEFDELVGFRDYYDEITYLHNFVHTKGYKFSNRVGLFKSNFQTFESSQLLKWKNLFYKVAVVVITAHLLKYPIGAIKYNWHRKTGIDNPFPVLLSSEIDLISKILPRNFFDEIEKIAQKDNFTQDLLNHVKNMPDISEEEIEQQAIELEKLDIESGKGFLQWEKEHRKLYERHELSDPERENLEKRIRILRKWAEENDLMESKIKHAKNT